MRMQANFRWLTFVLALYSILQLCLAKGPPAINIQDAPPPPSNVVSPIPSMNQQPPPNPSNVRQSPRTNQGSWPSPPTGEAGFNSNNNFPSTPSERNQDDTGFGWNNEFEGPQEGMNGFGSRDWDQMGWDHHHHHHHHRHHHWRPWGFGPPPPPPMGWFP